MSKTSAKQIAAEVRERIYTGDLAPGSQLPETPAEAVRLGVSQSMVKNAYQELARDGLTRGTKGKGTVVLDPARADLLAYTVVIGHDGRGYYALVLDREGNEVRFDPINRQGEKVARVQLVPAPPLIARALGIPAMTQVIMRDRRLGWKRGRDGRHVHEVLVWSRSYMRRDIVEQVPEVGMEKSGPGGIYARFEETLGGSLTWRGDVYAEPASREATTQLNLPSSAAVLRLLRSTCLQDGRVVEVLDQHLDASKFKLTYEFTRNDSATALIERS